MLSVPNPATERAAMIKTNELKMRGRVTLIASSNLFVGVFLLWPQMAEGRDDRLTILQAADRSIVVRASGWLPYCSGGFGPPVVNVSGNRITIEVPQMPPPPCPPPQAGTTPPDEFYHVDADVGQLPDGSYDVTWRVVPTHWLTLITTFTLMHGLLAQIPLMNAAMTAALAVALLAVGFLVLRSDS